MKNNKIIKNQHSFYLLRLNFLLKIHKQLNAKKNYEVSKIELLLEFISKVFETMMANVRELFSKQLLAKLDKEQVEYLSANWSSFYGFIRKLIRLMVESLPMYLKRIFFNVLNPNSKNVSDAFINENLVDYFSARILSIGVLKLLILPFFTIVILFAFLFLSLGNFWEVQNHMNKNYLLFP
jgi:hypothetical protein